MLPISPKNTFVSTVFALVLGLGLASVARAADMMPPVVSTVSPLTATAGQTTTFSITASDDVGVRNCYLVIGAITVSPDMTRVSGNDMSASYSKGYVFTLPGSYNVAARCADQAENVGLGSDVTVIVSAAADVTAPVLGSVTPSTAMSGSPTTLNVDFTDEVGVTACQFNPGSGPALSATLSGPPQAGSAGYTYTFPSAGTYSTSFTCTDAAGNVGTALRTVTVTGGGADVTAPVVGAVSHSTLSVGVAANFGVEYSDNVGVSSCFLIVDGVSVGSATLSGSATAGSANRSHTFSVAGSHTVSMSCRDAALNTGDSAVRTVTVATAAPAPAGDVSAPTFSGMISPLIATLNVPVALSSAYSDNVGVTECYLYVDGALAGGSSSGGTAGTTSRSHTFVSTGSHSARFQCRDAAGNVGVSATYTVNVSAPITSDRVAPVVGSLSNVPVTTNASIRYTTTVSDNDSGLARCELFVNGSSQGIMDITGANASRSHTFTAPGTYNLYVSCWDRAGNAASGAVTGITVSASTVPPSGQPPMGSLVKAMCPAYQVSADHPCRAVYYYGQDGRRHAFPNERVYFTWFRDFTGVREVTDTVLASFALGRNVNYRPGIRMVKFTTLNRVYAVGRGGVLRWVTTEDVARQLYGASWAAQIDDIADVFYTNYTFGTDITSSVQFNPSSESALAVTIDQNW